MSLVSTLRPIGQTFAAASTGISYSPLDDGASPVPFHHSSSYLALSRMLLRFQNLILLTPPTDSTSQPYDLTPLQRQIQAELWSPLPYHRTKWLHNVDSARNLLLQLERAALAIRVQRAKKDALKDLAEKRLLIKRLRSRVEEIGREVESMGEKAWGNGTQDDELLGERADDILENTARSRSGRQERTPSGALYGIKPISDVKEDGDMVSDTLDQKEALFGSSIRKRQGQSTHADATPAASKGQTTGFSNLPSTEKALADSSRTHEDLTASLVSMAAQLKQQTRAFQFSLDQDKGLLDRALDGLDRNISGMELASKNMAFLRRMSEGEGWWGRIKLYAIIFSMWIFAILLVFVGPKLRF